MALHQPLPTTRTHAPRIPVARPVEVMQPRRTRTAVAALAFPGRANIAFLTTLGVAVSAIALS